MKKTILNRDKAPGRDQSKSLRLVGPWTQGDLVCSISIRTKRENRDRTHQPLGTKDARGKAKKKKQ